MRGQKGHPPYSTSSSDKGRRRLRSFWGAARISGLWPDGPPLFRRAKTPWSIRIHIEFDPFIHLPFSCWLGAVCVSAARHSPPHLQSFLPVTTSLQHPQPRSTTVPPASVSRPRPRPPHADTPARWLPCVLCPASCVSRCCAVLCCGVLRCDNLTALGRQSYCRQLPSPV